MDLLDRYLAAIARELPRAQAADITAELKDALLSQIEEREAERGAPLDDKALEALLIEFGHPLLVAAHYRKTQQLIGPDVFPFWLATIRVVFAVCAAIMLAAVVVEAASATAPLAVTLQQVLAQAWPVAIFVFGGVTLAFAAIERASQGGFRLAWSPRQLPAPRSPARKPFNLASEIAMGGVFIVWWIGLLRFRDLIPIPSAIQVALAPAWAPFHQPILIYAVTELAINALELLRPGLARLNASLSLAKNFAGVVILYLLLQAGHWIQITAPTLPAHAQAAVQQAFDQGFQLGLIATALILAGKAVWDLWRLIRVWPTAGAPSRLEAGRRTA
jgi:hypothetical protein